MVRHVHKQDGSGELAGSLPDEKDMLAPTAAKAIASSPSGENVKPITYAKSYVAKKTLAVNKAQELLSQVLGIPSSQITKLYSGTSDKNSRGSLLLPSGKTVEVRHQDFSKFKYAFLTLGHITKDASVGDGQSELKDMLRHKTLQNMDFLETAFLIDRRKNQIDGEQKQFGKQDHFSLDINAIYNSDATIYIDLENDRAYVYSRTNIFLSIANAISYRGLNRGMGGRDDDAISVSLDLPMVKYRNMKDETGKESWIYNGQKSFQLDTFGPATPVKTEKILDFLL